jgi:hypothetical protein
VSFGGVLARIRSAFPAVPDGTERHDQHPLDAVTGLTGSPFKPEVTPPDGDLCGTAHDVLGQAQLDREASEAEDER